jgi:hypothetical protein
LRQPDGLLRRLDGQLQNTLKRHARTNEDQSVGFRNNQPTRDQWSVHFSGSSFGMRVGGIILARAVDDRELSDRIIAACRAFAMCRTETMTGQTVVIDSGRIFH